MSDHSLLQEIEEDLQRQQYEALWKRFGVYILVGALAIVLAAAGYNVWHSRNLAQQQSTTAALLTILDSKETDKAKQRTALQDYAKTHADINLATLANLQAAALAMKDGKPEIAIGIYDALAQNPTAQPAFRQLGDLLSVQVQMDNGDPAKLMARLQPLMATDGAWHNSAKEYSAHLALKMNDKTKAKQLFSEISLDTDAPQDMIQRATDMLHWLSEGA